MPPHTAIRCDGDGTLAILNRVIVIGNGSALDGAATTAGLPARIAVTRPASRHGTLPATAIALLPSPVQLELVGVDGTPLSPGPVAGCTAGPPKFTTNGDGLVSWYAATGHRILPPRLAAGPTAPGVCASGSG